MTEDGRSRVELRIIFAGSGEFGLPALGALHANHQVVHVFSQPDRPAGRGRELTPTPISQFALDHNLPLTRTADINLEPLPPADVMVVIAFGQKISDAVADHPRLGSVNLHSSRLPKYRGAAPINWAILNGDTITGNSIIRLAQRMDAGDVLAMSTLQIQEIETAGELHDRLASDGAPLMLQTLQQLATDTATQTPQDESQASKAPKLNRDATKIDWTRSAEKIASQIRGMHPWPGCRVRLVDPKGNDLARLTLVRARALPAKPAGLSEGAAPGTITLHGGVATSHGTVEILELQPEGKRPMPLQAYTNGHSWLAGARLESIT
jgi:methionyl-tRNA formyltransferase